MNRNNIAGTLTYDTKIDTKDLEKGLDKAGKSALTFGDLVKSQVLSAGIIGGFKTLGKAIQNATSALVDFAKKGIENASNLEEVQNVVDTTFGKSAETINKWAKEAATAYGMSELQAKKFNGTMGAMLKSMGLSDKEVLKMSTDMTGLAGDMASFYNLDHQEAFDKIRSGISGETKILVAY